MSSWSSNRVLCSIGIALLCGTAVPARAEVRRAVLVGIDKYAPAAAAPAGAAPSAGRSARNAWSNLDGAVNDAEAMRQVLVSRFGFRDSDVHVLTNAEASRDRIITAIRTWLIDAAAPGDVSVFFYAGHGSQVKNSMSAEADKMDESLVPADANAGRPDLRDKELARLFDDALDKKISLTAIIDSCHSGSIARGVGRPTKFRVLPPDERDVADPSTPVPPETRGALILSAAQDFQFAAETADDDSTSHGLFTWALLKILRSMPVNESADRMFLQLRAIMQAGDTLQEPVLAGTPERRRAPLFGVERTSAAGATAVAVQAVQADGSVLLQGGIAAGLRKGAELRRAGSPAGGALTLRVSKEQGLTRSVAVAVEGTTKDLPAGTLFEVTKWSAPTGPALRIWIGPPGGLADDLVRQAQRFAAGAAGLVPVDDPTTSDGPNNTIQWTGSAWQLAVAGGKALPLGSGVPTVPRDAPLVRDATGAARVTLNLPLPAAVKLGLGPGGDSIEVLSSPEHADYVLAGRQRANTLEYAWIRPLATTSDGLASTLPVRTDWIPLGTDSRALAASLEQLVTRLAAIRTWLQLESPPDSGRFPYHLALRNSVTGQLHTDGPARAGDRYGLVLSLDETVARGGTAVQRYVYVLALDGTGKTTLLFPSVSSGTVENYLPASLVQGASLPKQIALGPSELFGIAPPFGTDTYVMVTSETALPDPSVLEGDAVASRGVERTSADPLSRLLGAASIGQRGLSVTTPTDWSIERLIIRSVAK